MSRTSEGHIRVFMERSEGTREDPGDWGYWNESVPVIVCELTSKPGEVSDVRIGEEVEGICNFRR